MQSNIVGRSPIKDYQDVHNGGSTLKPGWSMMIGNLSTRYINLEEIFRVFMEKMFTNGYINAINILTWKKLKDKKGLSSLLFI